MNTSINRQVSSEAQMALVQPPRKARKPKAAPLSETELTHRLAAKYSEKAGNGNAYAFIPQVRNAAGFDASRTIDAYVMALWPSRGLTLTAFEIKSARSDWTRELHHPEKAETFCELADFFYLVVGREDIVEPGELPETWGLMVPHGKGLKVAKEAPALRDLTPAEGRRGPRAMPPAFSRSFLAALLRSATYVAQTTPEDIQAAEDRVRESERQRAEFDNERIKQQLAEAKQTIKEFQEASGVVLGQRWGFEPKRVGAAVKLILEGETQLDRLERRLDTVRDQAQAIVDATEQMRPQIEAA